MFDASRLLLRFRDLLAVVTHAFGWPGRVIEARRTLTLLAQMSDRERSDIGRLHADLADAATPPPEDDPDERLARARAIRAWYGQAPRGLPVRSLAA